MDYAGRNGSEMTMWLCRCDCGTERVVIGSMLRNGHSKSCGCGLVNRPECHPGERYGMWTVIFEAESDKNGKTMWLCRCDCGVERQVLASRLRHGRSQSCGCTRWNGNTIAGIWTKVNKKDRDLCWNWTSSTLRGYGVAYFQGQSWRAHRLIWTFVNGPIPDGLHVLHTCDNKCCCSPAHLFLGTQADNNRDMWAKGRANPGRVVGEQHGRSKLTANEVKEIRDLSPLLAPDELAHRYGISPSHTRAIIKYRYWRHV